MAPAPGFAPRGLLVQGPGSVVTGSGFNRNRYTLRELDNKALREYTYNRDTLGWTVDRDLIYRGSGQLLASWSQAEGARHFHLDHLGTPRLITNASAARVAFHSYFPYGEEATAINQNEIRTKFTGHERDLGNTSTPEDDLDYMHARYHNPRIGRFLSVDPVLQWRQAQAQPQLWNRYTYALGNPIRYIDPRGETPGTPTADKGNGCVGLFSCIYSFVGGWLDQMFAPGDGGPSEANVEALESEYGEANAAHDPAAAAQQGLNDATALIIAGAATAAIVVAENSAINVVTKGLGHAVKRHTVIGRQSANKSIFAAGENLVTLAKAASKVEPIPQRNGNLAFVVNAGRTIGHDRARGPTPFYTVVTDANRNLITMHPGVPKYLVD